MSPASTAGFAEIGRLLADLERKASDAERERTRALVSTLLQAQGAALEQLLARVSASAPALMAELAADPAIAPLLMLHGLHPRSLPERVRETVSRLEPRLAAQHAQLELLELGADGRVRLALRHRGRAEPLRAEIEEAFARAAADASDIAIEETVEVALHFDPQRGSAAR